MNANEVPNYCGICGIELIRMAGSYCYECQRSKEDDDEGNPNE